MGYTVQEIAEQVGGELIGDGRGTIEGVAAIDQAQPHELTFLADKKYVPLLPQCKAGAVIVTPGVEAEGINLIRHENPYFAFAHAIKLVVKTDEHKVLGVSDQAIVGDDVAFGEEVSIYPGAYIGSKVKIGARTRIYPGAHIGDGTTIGEDCIIYPNVTIYHGNEIANRVIIQGGAVIGGDGFGFATENGVHHKFPQIGRVVIEDDVEIGANSTVDRAALGETRIGKGTKIDNLVMIAHNVQIGQGCFIVSQVGISGSSKVGNYVTLAGQVGVVGHLTIGDQVTAGGQAAIINDIPAGETVLGSPAYPIRESKRIFASIRKLPDMRKKVSALEKKIRELEERLGE